MRQASVFVLAVTLFSICGAATVPADNRRVENPASIKDPDERKAFFVDAVTRGKGLMPWQEKGTSPEEGAFRRRIEERKERMLINSGSVKHPVLMTEEQIERARRNIKETEWGKRWFEEQKEVADYVVKKGDAWIDAMIPELTPWHQYGFTCPNCVGDKSQEGVGNRIIEWDCRNPDVIRCRQCGQTYPSKDYPETAILQAPRMRQTLTFYVNEHERDNPDDRTGKLAYHWFGRPIHISFTGTIRRYKTGFMIRASRSLALVYRLTGDPRYAEKAVRILDRLSHCYPKWLYHDYWDGVADCDPLYAAWHDRELELEWKRHLCSDQYKKDTPDRASMVQTYWGAGRYYPSTGGLQSLSALCFAYDLVCDAKDARGRRLWTDAMRSRVEQDLLLEWVIEAEPFLGGEGKAEDPSNKAPRIYVAQAAIAKALDIPQLADVALNGYELIRDKGFAFDGFSHECPGYNNMFLRNLLTVPEILDGFTWPNDYRKRSGTVDLFRTDWKLRDMLHAVVDQLRPDGRYAPLGDTVVTDRHGAYVIEVGLNRYPDYYRGRMPGMYGDMQPTEYAVFNLEPEDIRLDTGLDLPDVFYPAWMAAFLRHGSGREATMLVLSANPPGNHRQWDSLSIFYADRGQDILGDHGYLCDMPQLDWIKSTFSHNLVVVDDQKQEMRGRVTNLCMMFTTPIASAVECSSTAYPMCSEYRRMVAMIKGPGSETFLVDVFRVKGGGKHAFRVFSEIGASDGEDNGIEFVGADLPPEKPLPNFGGSIKKEHIFGLRDVRKAEKPDPGWQAVWKERDRSSRMWMLSDVDRLEVSHGPGQEQYFGQLGRRVRYVDAINEGKNLVSTFVAIHEPSGPDGSMPIDSAKLLEVSSEAGESALAVKIESKWGTYLLLSEFDNEADVGDAKFQGKFGLVKIGQDDGLHLVSCGARALRYNDFGFADRTARWTGRVKSHTYSMLTTETPMPEDFPAVPDDCTDYVLVDWGKRVTGYSVESVEDDTITVRRFGLNEPGSFDLPILRVLSQ